MLKQILHTASGPAGFGLAMLVLASYIFGAFAPFQFQPQTIFNGARWTDQGTIRFSSPGVAYTTAPAAWLDRAVEQGAFSLHLRVRSLSPEQTGPARIFTVSINGGMRNLTIGQFEDDLIVRLRTPQTSANGTPEYRIPEVFRAETWSDIGMQVRENELTIALDGRTVLSESLPHDALRVWQREFRVALGNELSCDRPWLGEVAACLVTVSGETVDYLKPGALTLPWLAIKRQSLYDVGFWLQHPPYLLDLLLNTLGFAALGFLLAVWRGEQGSFLLTVAVCALISLAAEAAQAFFQLRMTSASDWIANTSGAFAGALLARWLVATQFDDKARSTATSEAHLDTYMEAS